MAYVANDTDGAATTTAYGIALPSFLRQRRAADVPEDVEEDPYLAHFNDPNWDMDSTHVHGNGDGVSETSSATDVEMGNKRTLGAKYSTEKLGRPESFSGKSLEQTDDSTTRFDSASRTESTAVPEQDYNDESPYAEVRAAVSNIDDPSMPVSTFRMWVLGIFYTILISGLNQFFGLRYPSVQITGLVAQLTALPLGKGLEYILPRHRIRIPLFRGRSISFTLNDGSPFNVKEHTVITVMANVVVGGAYATEVIAAQRVFYGQNWPFAYQILLTVSSQLIGYAFGGLVRQFLVWPSSMIWPGALVNAALFNTLHKNFGRRDRGHMTRERFFCFALLASFVWYWVPGYLWTGLSVMNWVCWIKPNNIVVNQLFGTNTGLGMGILTFDWSMIAYIGSPLVVPWWAEANTFVSFVLWFWVLTPILYYRNVFFAKFLPISGFDTYDNTGASYDVTRIVSNGVFDVEKYKAYSPVFISTTFALSYGVSFAAFTAVIVHVFLWYRHDIMRQIRRSLKDERDVHARLMAAYPEVPHYWYFLLFVVAFVLGIVAIEHWPTQLPVWAYVLALLISLVLMVPCGIIQAITNQQVPLNVLVELIIGYALPGRPIAMMIFKTYGFIATQQGLAFAGDLKLGHYMKVPPRIMFWSQSIATVLSCFVVVGVQSWMFGNIEGMCTDDQKNGFICPSTGTFASASLLWGGIGPSRIFSKGAIYYPLVFFFLIGAIAPIPFYFLARKYPRSLWRYVNMPVFFNGVAFIPPASGINYASWFAVGFVFQWFMRRFHFRWWMRYNYILSAALDSGVSLALIVIFFCLQFPKNGTIGLNTIQAWWGNTGWMNNLDAEGAPFYTLAANETFGPSTWN
ncbi:OPT oligopeptide transporter [Punctularia strigosozonata HHB-11173 SS5]|uniref:OPT oligopeptide transporter n=1 Tax=Punctularia strigosozonata (strain HHB-11173) TaxID=741275 RepID=UPI0004417F13|nr:OPT oligopeptide transporter [Punctularia strigosozonata HHB-11173 SS5]EIN13377.1 OPT oligopeptide transporter [Punctularia strigosozonata HHB-11173 SS5]